MGMAFTNAPRLQIDVKWLFLVPSLPLPPWALAMHPAPGPGTRGHPPRGTRAPPAHAGEMLRLLFGGRTRCSPGDGEPRGVPRRSWVCFPGALSEMQGCEVRLGKGWRAGRAAGGQRGSPGSPRMESGGTWRDAFPQRG